MMKCTVSLILQTQTENKKQPTYIRPKRKQQLYTDLCRTVPLPADGRDATALPGLRAAPTDVALADAGCQHTPQSLLVLLMSLN